MEDIFEKLEGVGQRLQEILRALNEPSSASDPLRFQKLMKEQATQRKRSKRPEKC